MFNYVGLVDSRYELFSRNALLHIQIELNTFTLVSCQNNQMSTFTGASDNLLKTGCTTANLSLKNYRLAAKLNNITLTH